MASPLRCIVCDEGVDSPAGWCASCAPGSRSPLCNDCAARHAAPDRYTKFRGHVFEPIRDSPANLAAAASLQAGSSSSGQGFTTGAVAIPAAPSVRAGRRAGSNAPSAFSSPTGSAIVVAAPVGAAPPVSGGTCAVHRGEPVAFFCCEPTCYVPLCSQCVAGHPRHCFRPVGDVAAPLRRFLVHRAFATSLWAAGVSGGAAAGGGGLDADARALDSELEAARNGGGPRPVAPALPGDAAYGAPSAADDRLAALARGGTVADAEIASRLEALATAREALDAQLAEAVQDVNVAFDAAIAALEAREARLVRDLEVRRGGGGGRGEGREKGPRGAAVGRRRGKMEGERGWICAVLERDGAVCCHDLRLSWPWWVQTGVAGAQAALDDEAAAFVSSRKALSDLAADIRDTVVGGAASAGALAAAFPALRARLGAAFASAAALPAPRVAAAAVILDLAPVDRVARAASTLGDLELVEVRTFFSLGICHVRSLTPLCAGYSRAREAARASHGTAA